METRLIALIQTFCPMDPNKSDLALKLLAEGMKENCEKMDADKVQKSEGFDAEECRTLLLRTTAIGWVFSMIISGQA